MLFFDNEVFFNSGVICDSLCVSGEMPDFRHKLIIMLVIGSVVHPHMILRDMPLQQLDTRSMLESGSVTGLFNHEIFSHG